MTHIVRRVTHIFFALLIAVFSINLSGLMTKDTQAATNFFSDNCGTANDTYFIPTSPTNGSKYAVNGVDTQAGTYPANGTVTIEYKVRIFVWLTVSTDRHTFTNVPCPAAPTFTDACGTANDVALIPATHAQNNPYSYWLDTGSLDIPLFSNSYPGSGRGTIKAKDSLLRTIDSWQYAFSTNNCATPTAPSVLVDECGTANDTFTVPTTPGVIYRVNGAVVSGTQSTNGAATVTITAEAAPGYILEGTTNTWTLQFNTDACVADAFPNPAFTDSCGISNDTFTLTPVTGVAFKDGNGNTFPVNTPINTNGALSVVVTAEALPGYMLTGANSRTYTFTDVSCADISAVASCSQAGVAIALTNKGGTEDIATVNSSPVTVPANDSVTITVPYTLFKASATVSNGQSTLIDQTFDCTPGRGSIGGQGPLTTPVTKTVSANIMLPETGADAGDTLAKAFTVFMTGIITYGAVFFIVNRRDLTKK